MPVIVMSLSLGVSGVAGALFSQSPAPQSIDVSAAVLTAPGAGELSTSASSITVPITWTAPDGYAPTGYNVLRCSGASCTPVAIVGGDCAGTLVAVNCTDNDPALAPDTTYRYEIVALFNNWLSPPSPVFSLSTLGIPTEITSAESTDFVAGTGGSFTVTTNGVPTNSVITNASFSGPAEECTLSSPLAGVTFANNGDGTATISSTSATPVGTMTFCLNATNGVGTPALQTFTLTISPPTTDNPSLTFTDSSGNVLCTDGSNLAVMDAATTLYVSRSSGTSSVSVAIAESTVSGEQTPHDRQGPPSGDSLTIPANEVTSSTGTRVNANNSNGGVEVTASAPGYSSVTCHVYRDNSNRQQNN